MSYSTNNLSPMPFDHTHYLPVLRCKEAEKEALAQLASPIRAKMTPLIEIPRRLALKSGGVDANGRTNRIYLERGDPRVPSTLDSMLQKTTGDIKDIWLNKTLFLDLQHLYPEWRVPSGAHPVTACWNYAISKSLFPPTPIPVVTLSNDQAFHQAVLGILQIANVGVGLRIRCEELSDIQLPTKIMGLLNVFGLTPNQTDLIIDCGVVGENELDLASICGRVPWIEAWRSFSCVSGSFPENLTKLSVGEHELQRHEWNAFCNQIQSGATLPRIPTFGDFATQHGQYIETVGIPNISASIRYTAADKYVIVRGQSVKFGAKYMQYPANAISLCARSEFGSIIPACAGDNYIRDKADKMLEIEVAGKGTGTPTTWLQASLNRHWSVTATQISNLFGS